eukprot:gnl/Spiro4/24032_TR11907_c0_g1_i1.p1 gnl/Spiro4/24032_TR11907_c0_g1~~gnl/Spiro4/24032_TR11907_c0_g1_i1.p1  ORF type:complete len:185 (-),score=48.01 gnl/Spiro4/24032_TR11907_c0_g1_i1:51-605(-)
MVLIGDFLMYAEHRVMHIVPFLRNHIHSVHHKYTTVFSWAGGWVHPAEDAVVVACVIVTPWLIRAHPLSFWVYVVLWVVCLIDEHSGHDVWWSPARWMPFHIGGGGLPHDIHHTPFTTRNYGFMLCLWDQIFHTYESTDSWALKMARKRIIENEKAALLVKTNTFETEQQTEREAEKLRHTNTD